MRGWLKMLEAAPARLPEPCCGSCRFWVNPTWHGSSGYGPEFKECQRIQHEGRGDIAITVDGDGYGSSLLTRANFACNLFEAR